MVLVLAIVVLATLRLISTVQAAREPVPYLLVGIVNSQEICFGCETSSETVYQSESDSQPSCFDGCTFETFFFESIQV